ncbi:MAG TPA: hypothetical protein VMD27_10225 [Candidatus Aquilonibacter sp.]|nr:hypothetical protein [Candidatus Aquilonibacter sp.]
MNKASNSLLKIVIVHGDLITGIQATAVLRRLAAGLDAEFEIKCDDWQIDSGVWKFEMLHDPELWEQAASEAVEADMIIISVGSEELPVCMERWIESVLSTKAGAPAALVALLDRSNEAFGDPLRSEVYLRRLAEQFGLDFFCNTDDQTPHIKSAIESIVTRSRDNSAIWRDLSPELCPRGVGV